jgi:hypothetical protein
MREFAMAMVIYFHYFCLTLIQCSFNVALLNIGSDCNLLIKNVISISYIVVVKKSGIQTFFCVRTPAYAALPQF